MMMSGDDDYDDAESDYDYIYDGILMWYKTCRNEVQLDQIMINFNHRGGGTEQLHNNQQEGNYCIVVDRRGEHIRYDNTV